MIKLKDILKEWSEVDTGPHRWSKPVGDKYTAYEKATNKSLKEFRPHGNISGEPADVQGLKAERIEADMKSITGQNVRVKKKGNLGEWKVEWSYMRRELPSDKWNKAIKHITDVYGAYIDKEWTRNDYEANYEPEEPPEWTPSIYFEEA